MTYRIDKNILYVAVEGRVDASNAAETEQKMFEIKRANPDKHLVIDAERLEYISSAGLRVILKLRKEAPKLAIINVSHEVYDVFDMTGFTEMVTIEKAFPHMSAEGCEFIAKGANGAVYRYDDETILKLYFAKDALPEIKQEQDNARRAFVLGVNTAIPYGIVRVGDGYGTVAELLHASSLSKLIQEKPEDLTQAVAYFVDLLKSVHAIDLRTALLIGCFQCLSLIPGTSRSGSTILGGILLGVSRGAASEFSFFLAIPTMLGASALKLLKFMMSGVGVEALELGILAVGCVVSFLVSLFVIKALMEYVRKHSFSVFGTYRIVLGSLVLVYFAVGTMLA